MDWDLWGPPYYPDPSDGEEDSYVQDEMHYDVYFGNVFDVIEEDALNEKCCIQVLGILITKADTDIDQLERDLISLESELAWIENEDWCRMCSEALTAKINSLDISLSRLRSKDKDEVEVHLLMHSQPIETLHDILKAMLSNFIPKEEKPTNVKDSIISGLTKNAEILESNVLGENEKFISCCWETIPSDEKKEFNAICPEHNAILSPCPEVQETVCFEPTTIVAKDSSPHSLGVAPVLSGENKLLGVFGPEYTREAKGGECGSTPRTERVIQKSSSKSSDKRKTVANTFKVQLANTGASISVTDASEEVAGNLTEEKRQNGSGSTSVYEDVEEDGFMFTTDIPPAAKTDFNHKFKLANTVEDLDQIGNHNATDCSSQVKKSCKSALIVNGKSEVGEDSEVICRGIVSSSSLKLKSNRNSPTVDKAKDGTSNTERKQYDISTKAARQRTTKESKIVASNHKMEGKRGYPPQILNVEGSGVNDTQRSIMTPVLQSLLDQEEKNATKLLLKAERKTIPILQIAEVTAEKKASNFNFSVNSRKVEAKTSIESNVPILKEIEFSEGAVVSSSYTILEGKKRRESGPNSPNANQKQSMDGKIAIKPVPPAKFEAEKHGAVADGSPGSVSQACDKKRKTCADGQLAALFKDSAAEIEFTMPPRERTDCVNKGDISVGESCSNSDCGSEDVVSSTQIMLKNMKKEDLRQLAKQLKLTKYCKLRKQMLVELLVNQVRIAKPVDLQTGGV